MEILIPGQPSSCSVLRVSFGRQLCYASARGYIFEHTDVSQSFIGQVWKLTFFERSLQSGFEVVSVESGTAPGKVHHFDPRKLG